MIDIKTGAHFRDLTKKEVTMTRGGFIKSIIASGIAPSITLGASSLAGSANAGGMMRNVGARNAVMFGGKSLPYDEELDYISSNGHQMIDTGYVYVPEDIVTTDGRFVDGNNGIIHTALSPNGGCWLGRQESYWFINPSLRIKYTIRVVVRFYFKSSGERGHSTNGGIWEIRADSSWVRAIGQPLTIFAAYEGSAIKYNSNAESYGISVLRDGIVVLNEIPVIKNGIPCMYDSVSKTFSFNVGTGSFGYKKKDGTIVDPT